MVDMSKRVALVAHDGKKEAMAAWAYRRKRQLEQLSLCATGTTGSLLNDRLDLDIKRLKSGPQGGDAQLGAMIANGELDALIFFIDPLASLPHDVDVKSLVRLATLYDIPLALNQASAEAVLSSL